MNREKFWVKEAQDGFGMTVEVEEVLYSHRSAYQQIDLYQTAKLGKLLLLDGIIQLTEFDEFAYQEMMAHLPLMAHPAPERVLVIGGGDGGVLREVGRHPECRQIELCEIDAEVIEVAKKFIPSMSCGYDDPRVTVHIADGSRFVAEHPATYDVIIVDSTDPGGPGEPLFGAEFYANLKRALRPGGVIAAQSESPYLLSDIVSRLCGLMRGTFRHAAYAMVYVPTYPTGTIGVGVASDAREVRAPVRELSAELRKQLRYYTPELHRAAFELPRFAQKFFPPEL